MQRQKKMQTDRRAAGRSQTTVNPVFIRLQAICIYGASIEIFVVPILTSLGYRSCIHLYRDGIRRDYSESL
jgi:hypothetical protein